MAMARPPSVSVLMLMPNPLKTNAVITNESGIAVSVMMVVRKFRRNKNSTMMTKMKPSRRACSTLVSELTMKFFC